MAEDAENPDKPKLTRREFGLKMAKRAADVGAYAAGVGIAGFGAVSHGMNEGGANAALNTSDVYVSIPPPINKFSAGSGDNKITLDMTKAMIGMGAMATAPELVNSVSNGLTRRTLLEGAGLAAVVGGADVAGEWVGTEKVKRQAAQIRSNNLHPKNPLEHKRIEKVQTSWTEEVQKGGAPPEREI